MRVDTFLADKINTPYDDQDETSCIAYLLYRDLRDEWEGAHKNPPVMFQVIHDLYRSAEAELYEKKLSASGYLGRCKVIDAFHSVLRYEVQVQAAVNLAICDTSGNPSFDYQNEVYKFTWSVTQTGVSPKTYLKHRRTVINKTIRQARKDRGPLSLANMEATYVELCKALDYCKSLVESFSL